MKVLRAALLLLGSTLAALAQDPFSGADPYESRFKAHPNFQIKFKAPEKGGEVRLYTKKPVRFEKDQYWEGSEEVVIEYQDIKITADEARYDFPTKTAVLIGHVVIDQGPTRLSGVRGTFHLDTKTGVLEDGTADLPPTYHIVGKTISKIGEATYRIEDGLFTACDVPEPAWSFTMADATITLDDYARMKDVAFRAGTVPLLWTPYLIWPTKEDRASGMLVPGLGYSNQHGAFLGPQLLLGHGPVDGPDDAARRLGGRVGRARAGVRAGGRRPSRPASSRATWCAIRTRPSACPSPRRRPTAATASARCPTARSASTRRSPSGAGSCAWTTSPTTCPGTCAASSRSARTPTSSSSRTSRRASR